MNETTSEEGIYDSPMYLFRLLANGLASSAGLGGLATPVISLFLEHFACTARYSTSA